MAGGLQKKKRKGTSGELPGKKKKRNTPVKPIKKQY